MIENLSSPSINDIIFYASSLMPNILDSYKSLIVCEIKQQIGDTSCNLSDLFYRITKFPFYLLSKMIQVIKYKKQSITIDNFINFLFDLFACADLNKRIELLFNILDFDNDNIVNIEDILFLYKNIYMIQYKSRSHIKELKDIINISKLQNSISKERFISFIKKENSDIFFLFFLLLNAENILSKHYLEIFIKYNVSSKKQIFDSNAYNDKHIKDPSLLLYKFSKEALNISLISEDAEMENDFEELEEFENNISTCMSGILDDENRRSAKLSDKSLLQIHFSSKQIINLGSPSKSHMNMPRVSISNNCIRKLNTMIEQKQEEISSALFDEDSLYCEVKLRKLVRDEQGTNEKLDKVKVIIKNKLLFVLSKRKKKKDRYKIREILLLNNNYGLTVGKVLDSQTGKTYYAILLNSNNSASFHREVSLYSKKQSKILKVYNLINKAKNLRPINLHYSFDRELASGAFGKIFLGTDIQSNRKLAIKKISKTIQNQAWIWEQSIFSLLITNPNENIIKAFDIFDTLNSVYFIYEYLPYGTLRSFLLDKKAQLTFSKELFISQLSNAISHLHSLGIVHRDIKPDNLLINYTKGNYIIKLIDFGLGKIISKYEYTTEPFGSLAYSAPEIVEEKQYSYSPDIWSIGMIAYFIINQKDPFYEWKMNMSYIKELIREGNIQCLFAKKEMLISKDKSNSFLFQVMKKCLVKKNRPSIEELIRSINELYKCTCDNS